MTEPNEAQLRSFTFAFLADGRERMLRLTVNTQPASRDPAIVIEERRLDARGAPSWVNINGVFFEIASWMVIQTLINLPFPAKPGDAIGELHIGRVVLAVDGTRTFTP